MTLAERRAAVHAALIENPPRSDRSIAIEVGCSRDLVAIMRARLVRDGTIRPGPVVGRDGKSYRFARKDPVPRIEKFIWRISRTIDATTGLLMADAWQHATPHAKQRLIDAMGRLQRRLRNLRSCMPGNVPRIAGPRFHIHRDPRRHSR